MKLFKTKSSRRILISTPFWAFIYCYLFIWFPLASVLVITALFTVALFLFGFLSAWADSGEDARISTEDMNPDPFMVYCRDNIDLIIEFIQNERGKKEQP